MLKFSKILCHMAAAYEHVSQMLYDILLNAMLFFLCLNMSRMSAATAHTVYPCACGSSSRAQSFSSSYTIIIILGFHPFTSNLFFPSIDKNIFEIKTKHSAKYNHLLLHVQLVKCQHFSVSVTFSLTVIHLCSKNGW